jgi:hypothetical protein
MLKKRMSRKFIPGTPEDSEALLELEPVPVPEEG